MKKTFFTRLSFLCLFAALPSFMISCQSDEACEPDEIASATDLPELPADGPMIWSSPETFYVPGEIVTASFQFYSRGETYLGTDWELSDNAVVVDSNEGMVRFVVHNPTGRDGIYDINVKAKAYSRQLATGDTIVRTFASHKYLVAGQPKPYLHNPVADKWLTIKTKVGDCNLPPIIDNSWAPMRDVFTVVSEPYPNSYSWILNPFINMSIRFRTSGKYMVETMLKSSEGEKQIVGQPQAIWVGPFAPFVGSGEAYFSSEGEFMFMAFMENEWLAEAEEFEWTIPHKYVDTYEIMTLRIENPYTRTITPASLLRGRYGNLRDIDVKLMDFPLQFKCQTRYGDIESLVGRYLVDMHGTRSGNEGAPEPFDFKELVNSLGI